MELLQKETADQIFIGCAGYTNRDWKGIFFPEEMPPKDHLKFYASQLKAVEINSTFYRRPMQKTLDKMYTETPRGFRFFIKIPKTVTHLKKLENTFETVNEFCGYIQSGLKEKLAGFLFQLPPSFFYSEENLKKVIKTVHTDFLNVVEFRHQSWWTKEILDILAKKNIIFAGVSIPKNIPDDFVINNPDYAYYRLHGVPTLFKSEYSREYLKNLAEKMVGFKGTSYVMFNNTWGNAGIKNALDLTKCVAERKNNY